MRNVIYRSVFIMIFLLLSCETRTYEEVSGNIILPQTVKYSQDIQPIITGNCTVCHSPGGLSGFFPLTDYTLVKNAIEKILDRVERPNGDPQKMPQGGSLSQAQIDLLKKWKSDGLQE